MSGRVCWIVAVWLLDRPLHLFYFLCEKYIGGGVVVVKGIEEHEREGGKCRCCTNTDAVTVRLLIPIYKHAVHFPTWYLLHPMAGQDMCLQSRLAPTWQR